MENKPEPTYQDLLDQIESLQNDLTLLGGLGCWVPLSFYNGISAIEYIRQHGIKGVRTVVGLEWRCTGEGRSILAQLLNEKDHS